MDGARNSHFMFKRGYIDYHADRFEDHSLICMTLDGRIRAILPANAKDGLIYSHGGLSFGGLLLAAHCGVAEVLAMFEGIRIYAADAGLRRLIYKPIPHIHHLRPAEEDLYALFRCRAKVQAMMVSTTIHPTSPLHIRDSKQKDLKSSRRHDLQFQEHDDFGAYFDMLTAELRVRHGRNPTHTAAEMRLLKARFPDNIFLRVAMRANAIVAGVIIYESGRVAHLQYCMATQEGRRLRALAPLLTQEIERARSAGKFFDFGHSNEDGGAVLNETLCAFKERFGGSATVQTIYEVDL